MKELKIPTKEDIADLQKMVTLSDLEQGIYSGIKKQMNEEFGEVDERPSLDVVDGLIKFYSKCLDEVKKSGSSRALERMLMAHIGHEYEWAATNGEGWKDLLTRSKAFESAALWYYKADEVFGFYTDFSFKVGHCLLGASHYLKKTGSDAESVESMYAAGCNLIETILKGISNDAEIIWGNNAYKDYFINASKKIVDGIVGLYVLEGPPIN